MLEDVSSCGAAGMVTALVGRPEAERAQLPSLPRASWDGRGKITLGGIGCVRSGAGSAPHKYAIVTRAIVLFSSTVMENIVSDAGTLSDDGCWPPRPLMR